MKKIITAAALSCAIVLAGITMCLAGALDRTATQPRTNPVTQGMIRVPGVVGLDQQAAMATIQQAGLGVSVRPSKKKPKDQEGQEGKVISQVPNPGGTAMYGTTVTIYVFKPAPVTATPAATAAPAADSSATGTQNTNTMTWGIQPITPTDTTTIQPQTQQTQQ